VASSPKHVGRWRRDGSGELPIIARPQFCFAARQTSNRSTETARRRKVRKKLGLPTSRLHVAGTCATPGAARCGSALHIKTLAAVTRNDHIIAAVGRPERELLIGLAVAAVLNHRGAVRCGSALHIKTFPAVLRNDHIIAAAGRLERELLIGLAVAAVLNYPGAARCGSAPLAVEAPCTSRHLPL
jgi:hypothetical protein